MAKAPESRAAGVQRGRCTVGIDLGTTHTVVAYAEPAAAGQERIRVFEVEQLVAPGEIAARPLLPSLRYQPGTGELTAADLRLPWSPAAAGADADTAEAPPPPVIGALARRLGAQVPGRLVASAKSWLSHTGVDREAAILPWGAGEDVAKVSPVEASASYLAHVRAAWDSRFPKRPLGVQDLVLTLPASFDDAARALTLAAARRAGLPQLKLLEEPQAAFYDWLFRHRATLAVDLAGVRRVLVVDVGGGTTDFSLIDVAWPGDGAAAGAQPVLTRVGVGDHLMLGGDNMDLALAHHVERRLAGTDAAANAAPPPARLSATALSQLLQRCRAAKELLLGAEAPERSAVTLLGSGSKLVGGARTVELGRDEVRDWLVEGFMPLVPIDAPVQRPRAGLAEFGLPHASDAAITRHLAAFLLRHAGAEPGSAPIWPDTLLLNGGVFHADALARRLQEQLALWCGAPLRLLHNPDTDLAVARGAVAYGLAHRAAYEGRAGGLRIGGGSARSYYLLLAGDRQAVCVLPRGSEAGVEQLLPGREFALRLGQPVRFHLVSTTADAGDLPPALGALVEVASLSAQALPPLATVVEAGAAGTGPKREIEVRLATALTELGTLELHCVARDEPTRRWRLEFQLRGEAPQATGAALPPRFTEAVERIEAVFGARSAQVQARDVKQLRTQLEQLLGARERWPTPLLRALYDALWQRARGRRRSAEHERVWLNLAGWCLRPGFGDALDPWRIEQLWTQFESGVQHGHEPQVAADWWTLWRRVAGGLPEAAQTRLLDDFAFNVQGAGMARPAGLVQGSDDDMLRLAAGLERIPAAHKAEIGAWMLGRLSGSGPEVAGPGGKSGPAKGQPTAAHTLWGLGRIGARQPLHGSAHEVVAAEVAAGWVEALLALDWKRQPAAAFAAAQIARLSGDRSRDLDAALRERVARRLATVHAAPTWATMLREVVVLDDASQAQAYGDSLPPGLKLLRGAGGRR